MVENREEEDGEGEEERCWSDAIAAVVDAVDEKIRLTDEHERFETGERAEETQEQGEGTPARREIRITEGPSRTPSPGPLKGSLHRRKSTDEGRFLKMSPAPDAKRAAARRAAERSKSQDPEYDVFDLFSDAWKALTSGNINDDDFHRECLRRARRADLSSVSSMRIFQKPEGFDARGRPSLLVYGAHYRRKIPDDDDESFQLVLLAVRAIDEIVFSPNGYNIVYFHSECDLPVTPNITFMKKLHAALGADARTNLNRLFVVHSNFMLRAHVAILASFEPFYRKVQYVETLEELYQHVPRDGIMPIIPGYVYDFDAVISPRTHGRHNHASVAAACAPEDDGVTSPAHGESGDAVSRLMRMGFTRTEAEDALLKSGNDVKIAAVKLIETHTPTSPKHSPGPSPRVGGGDNDNDVEL